MRVREIVFKSRSSRVLNSERRAAKPKFAFTNQIEVKNVPIFRNYVDSQYRICVEYRLARGNPTKIFNFLKTRTNAVLWEIRCAEIEQNHLSSVIRRDDDEADPKRRVILNTNSRFFATM